MKAKQVISFFKLNGSEKPPSLFGSLLKQQTFNLKENLELT